MIRAGTLDRIQRTEKIENCLVAEPDKVLVGELKEWVANPLGPGQTSALQMQK